MSMVEMCPFCGARLSIFPVTPSGDRILFYTHDNAVASGHFYACCTNACAGGAFRFQFDMESIPYSGIMTDDMVSWYYCTINANLTEAEFSKENEYRKQIGKPILLKRTARSIASFTP